MPACPLCPHCPTVVLALQMLERRVRALEEGITVRVTSAPPNAIQEQERQLIIDALKAAKGIQSHAAGLIGISARKMHYLVAKHQLGHLCPLVHGRGTRS